MHLFIQYEYDRFTNTNKFAQIRRPISYNAFNQIFTGNVSFLNSFINGQIECQEYIDLLNSFFHNFLFTLTDELRTQIANDVFK